MLKYNALMFEVNGKLKYERHPDIARSETPTKQQLRELVDRTEGKRQR